MAAGRTLTQQLLEREAEAWRDLLSAEYDQALCRILDTVNAAPHVSERVAALLALSSQTLRRNGPTLTESRFCCAESLLALVPKVSEPALLLRIRQLFLLAWLRLGAVAERGPESISVTPHLPAGVALPDGVDPAAISDPALREQAQEITVCHGEAVERWNARQRALSHLQHLATLILSAGLTFSDHEFAAKELISAMSLAPGVSSALRHSLEDEAG